MASEKKKKSSKSNKSEQKRTVQRLRQANIAAEVAAGKSTIQVAEEMNISRTTVSKALNSGEVQEIVKAAENRLIRMMDKALSKVEQALDQDVDLNNGLKAAIAVLKNFGVLKEKLDLQHHLPEPMVVELLDGGQIIAGAGITEDQYHS